MTAHGGIRDSGEGWSRNSSIRELLAEKSKKNMCGNCRKSNHTRCYGVVRLPYGGGTKPCKCKRCEELKSLSKDSP